MFKEEIKNALLMNLATPSNVVRTQVAAAIAVVASIELPRKEWTDLIDNLTANSEHESDEIRMASLQTLGYICDEITANDISDVHKSKIIQALTRNITKDSSKIKLCNLAIKAFFSALPFVSNFF